MKSFLKGYIAGIISHKYKEELIPIVAKLTTKGMEIAVPVIVETSKSIIAKGGRFLK